MWHIFAVFLILVTIMIIKKSKTKKTRNKLSKNPMFIVKERNIMECKLCGVTVAKRSSNIKRHLDSLRHNEFANKKRKNSAVNLNEVVINSEEMRCETRVNANFSDDSNENLNPNLVENSIGNLNGDSNSNEISIQNLDLNSVEKPKDDAIRRETFKIIGNEQKSKITCITCNCEIYNSIPSMDRHLITLKHQQKELIKSGKFSENIDVEKSITEIQLAAACISQDYSYLSFSNLLQTLKFIIHDSEILEKIPNSTNNLRKRLNDIVRFVIAPCQQERLIPILNSQEFSILVDESTDITNKQSMVIIVRFVDYMNRKISDTVWDYIPCRTFESNTLDAENCFQLIVKSFENKGVFFQKNAKFFCSDTCNLMMGVRKSVATKLKNYCPGIKICKCNCHIENLAANFALTAFPDIIKTLPADVHKYFKDSARREHNMLVLEAKVGLNHLKALKHTFLRWLSYLHCIRNLLRRWTLLRTIFKNDSKYYELNKIKVSEKYHPRKFLEYFSNPMIHASFMFLEAAFSRLCIVNELLQSEKPILSVHMHNIVGEMYKEFMSFYMNQEYVDRTHIDDLDPLNVDEYKECQEIYIGMEAEKLLRETDFSLTVEKDDPDAAEKTDFNLKSGLRLICRDFYIKVCVTLKEKCQFKDSRCFFNPKNVFEKKFHDLNPTLEIIYNELNQLNICKNEFLKNIIGQEWEKLLTYEFPENFRNSLEKVKKIDDFWFLLLRF